MRRTQLPPRAATLLTWERRLAHTSTYNTSSAFSCVKSKYLDLTLLATLPAWAWRVVFFFEERPPRALPNRPPWQQSSHNFRKLIVQDPRRLRYLLLCPYTKNRGRAKPAPADTTKATKAMQNRYILH